MTKLPCKDCTKRYLGCHSECNDYNSAKAQMAAEKVAIYNAKQIDKVCTSMVIEARLKYRRDHGSRRK